MGTTKAEIRGWLGDAKKAGATHMLVVCYTFDYTGYPVNVMPGKDVQEALKENDGPNMRQLVEVYAMHLDLESQLEELRAYHPEVAGDNAFNAFADESLRIAIAIANGEPLNPQGAPHPTDHREVAGHSVLVDNALKTAIDTGIDSVSSYSARLLPTGERLSPSGPEYDPNAQRRSMALARVGDDVVDPRLAQFANLGNLSFASLRVVNQSRCDRWHGDAPPWNLRDWSNALGGELGEAQNIIKKLHRLEQGLPGNKAGETREVLIQKLKGELADVQLYLDLLASAAGIDLGQATIDKFNEKSVEFGFPERLGQ